jgi:hypothetical protein
LRMRRSNAAKPRWRSPRTKGDVAASLRTASVSNPSARAASSSSSAGRIARNRPMSITWIRSSPAMFTRPARRLPPAARPARVEVRPPGACRTRRLPKV